MASDVATDWIVEHGTFVCRVLRHLGVSEHPLEDQCPEVFILVVRQHAEFHGGASLRTGIRAICRNLVTNERHRRRKPELLRAAGVDDTDLAEVG